MTSVNLRAKNMPSGRIDPVFGYEVGYVPLVEDHCMGKRRGCLDG